MNPSLIQLHHATAQHAERTTPRRSRNPQTPPHAAPRKRRTAPSPPPPAPRPPPPPRARPPPARRARPPRAVEAASGTAGEATPRRKAEGGTGLRERAPVAAPVNC